MSTNLLHSQSTPRLPASQFRQIADKVKGFTLVRSIVIATQIELECQLVLLPRFEKSLEHGLQGFEVVVLDIDDFLTSRYHSR